MGRKDLFFLTNQINRTECAFALSGWVRMNKGKEQLDFCVRDECGDCGHVVHAHALR